MSSHGFSRWVPKRRRTNKLLSQLMDLNSTTTSEAYEGDSFPSSEPVSRIQTSRVDVAGTSQLLVPAIDAESHIGTSGYPINVEVIDDDILMYSSSSLPPAEQPNTVIIDDDSETIPAPVEAPDVHVNTQLSLGRNPRQEHRRVIDSRPVINLLETPENCRIPTPPAPEKPKEPEFSCPVCMNELVDATSTICGHIFCKNCIKASIQAQKKCPTCRRKLTMNSIHRIYLPTTK
ncbi:hypothetical protein GUJ93_ZPchr0001g29520 [Zizania palustris]|uniref:RING-type domain-containing protein n=1 Tax=Zizania palustris TaxID=103762 RepID=A0A8J5RTM3_ZIZPA|nr:hypothetical protein GUJ93_ZPchr0001g29520 [Zizania palustris]